MTPRHFLIATASLAMLSFGAPWPAAEQEFRPSGFLFAQRPQTPAEAVLGSRSAERVPRPIPSSSRGDGNRAERAASNNGRSPAREGLSQGLRGRDLAESIHRQLNARGIPAGGNRVQGPPPIAGQSSRQQEVRGKARGRAAGDPAAESQSGARRGTRSESLGDTAPSAQGDAGRGHNRRR